MITASLCPYRSDNAVRADLMIGGESIGECTLWPSADGLEIDAGCITYWADDQLVAYICAIAKQSDRRARLAEIIAAVTLAESDAEICCADDDDDAVGS